MLIDNYQKEKLTINIVWANIFGLLILIPITLVYGIPFYFLWIKTTAFDNLSEIIENQDFNLFGGHWLFYVLAGIILHELIHGITWAIFAKEGFKSIKFGVMWKMLTPYCHCKEPLLVKHYIFGALMPTVFLGLFPAVISIAIGHFGLLLFAIFFTMAASGDFLIVNLLMKEKMTDHVQDHPSEAGCYIYRNN